MLPYLLSASILSADFSDLAGQIRQCESAGVDWLHIDVMDGSFVPNISMGPFIVETCRRLTGLPLDVHLMIENPDRHLEAFANAGATTLTVHIENTPHIYRTLQAIRAHGCKPAIALNPGTPSNRIEAVLPLVDMVLVMTVNPGFSGQQFIPEVVAKIAEVKEMLKEKNFSARIEVDGGINEDTLPAVAGAGANTFVAATAIFKFPAGIAAGAHLLRSKLPRESKIAA